MSGTNKNIVYWDTCIFYALIKKEMSHGEEALDAIREMADRMDDGGLYIMTSQITYGEVLRGNLIDANGKDCHEDFKKFRYKPRMLWRNVTSRISELTHEIRSEIHTGTDKRIGAPDAIHLATAIINKVGVFYTFDRKDKNKYKTLGLLPLSQKIHEKYHLIVSKPKPSPQTTINFDDSDDEETEDTEDTEE